MRLKKSLSIMIVFVLFVQSTILVSIASGSPVDSLSTLDKGIYKIIKSKCQIDDALILNGDAFLESMKSSFHETSMVLPEVLYSAVTSDTSFFKNLLSNKGLSPGMKTILDSDGLFVALRECFSEPGRRDQFVLNLIVSDVVGRGVGSVQGVLFYLFSYRFILKFATKIYDILLTTRLGARLRLTGANTNIAYIVSGMLALMSLPILYSTHQNIKEAAREDDNLKQSEQALLNETLVRIKYLTKQKKTANPQTLQSIEQEIVEYKRLYSEIYNESLKYGLFDLKNYTPPEQI